MTKPADCAVCHQPHPWHPKRGYRAEDGHAYQPISEKSRRLTDQIEGEIVLGIARKCPHCRCLVNAARDDIEHHLAVCGAREPNDGMGRTNE